jgi:hypothetical protein
MPQAGLSRNVFVYDANIGVGEEHILVAGMHQFGLTTGAEFYFCLEFCFHVPQPSQFRLMATDGSLLPRDVTPVVIGIYRVVSVGMKPLLFCV